MRPFSKSSLPEKPAAPKTRAHRTTKTQTRPTRFFSSPPAHLSLPQLDLPSRRLYCPRNINLMLDIVLDQTGSRQSPIESARAHKLVRFVLL